MKPQMIKQEANPLGVKPVSVLLAEFAIPSIIAMLVSALYNIVDQFFIGHSVGMLGNAATNVAFPLTISCTAISLLCGIGGAANFNLNMGRGNTQKAAKYAGNAVSMCVVIGILLCIATRLFLRPKIGSVRGDRPDACLFADVYGHYIVRVSVSDFYNRGLKSGKGGWEPALFHALHAGWRGGQYRAGCAVFNGI